MIEPTQEQLYMANLVNTGKHRTPTDTETEAEYVQFCQDRWRGAFTAPGINRFATKTYLLHKVGIAKTKDDLREVLTSLISRLL
jgi:hypothetical protein